MAEINPPLFMDVNSAYSGDELGLPHRDLISEGVVGINDLKVSQRGAGANLSVDVAIGAAWVTGDTNTAAQPTYRVRSDAVVNLGISPDPTNPRKVLVVAQITDETFAGTGRNWALVAIHGTPAGSPTEPALPASALPLALIDVTAADASIVDAQITDRRVRANPTMGQVQPQGRNFTPLWIASGTAPAIGNGTLLGRYIEVGKLVFVTVELTAGSTTTFGTGIYTIAGLPVAPRVGQRQLLTCDLLDAGTQHYTGWASINGLAQTEEIVVGSNAVGPTGWAATSPFTFGNTDRIMFSGTYEAVA